MNLIARLSIAALIVPCIQCQAQVGDGDFEGDESVAQPVLADEPGETPDCGADGVCRLNVCQHDPDCPDAPPPPPSVTWKLTGDVMPGGVSGISSTHMHGFGDEDSLDTAAYAILSRELSNEPCYVAVGLENLNQASDDSTPIVDHCGSGGPTSSTLHADFLDVDAGGVGDHVFITQVNVCMNADGTKVKGMSAVGLKLNSDGTKTTVTGDPDDRANCAYWSGGASCSAGQVATQVHAYFNYDAEPKDLIGIGLSCRKVTL